MLGVYRQEFYQYIEQISKHLWAVDAYEYVVAVAGLAYMTKNDCFYVGTSSSGQEIYAGVAPKTGGKFEMALYTDDYCLTPNDSLGLTYDDLKNGNNRELGNNNNGYNGGDDNGWYQATQEYTLTNLNNVYEDFKYCTLCIDYPTYQDGYVIGDNGMDDDDLINQCWKFYSHDSYTCEADCISLGHSQGTIVSVVVGDKTYGQVLSNYYDGSGSGYESSAAAASTATVPEESRFTRLLANAFVTFSFIVFIATFLAFAVARRSRYRESRSSKSRRLLDDDEDGRSPRSRRSSRSKSKSREVEDGDGLFRSSSRKSRSKSGSKRSKTRSKSHGREVERDADYDPPKSPSRSRSRKRSSSKGRRQHIDDF